MNLDEAKALYKKAKLAYYNERPIMPDARFDRLEDAIKAKDPKWKELKRTGVPVGDKKTEVVLSHFMPSLPKVYPEATEKWLVKHPSSKYIVMDKLDGSSLQLTITKGEPVKLVTRGNGTKGGDISFLLKHLKLPRQPKAKGTQVYRCEAVMEEKTFQKKWSTTALGEKDGFDNSRNMVNGLLNRREGHPALKNVDLVVLGQFDQPLLTGLQNAAAAGFKVVHYALVAASGPEILAERLQSRKTYGPYAIDGLVLAPLNWNMVYADAEKPKGITAFKFNDMADAVEAKVIKIIYQVSGRRRIIPKILIDKSLIGGVKVKHCTVHNAQWMMDRHIGPGAVVKIVRSGGVIPKIVDVVKKGKLQLPDVPHTMQGVHFVVSSAKSSKATNAVINAKNIVKFVRTFGIEHLAEKTVSKISDMGMLTTNLSLTPLHFVAAHKAGVLESRLVKGGIGAKMAEKIEAEFAKAFSKPVSMRDLMVGLQVFPAGIGDRKLRQIEDAGIALKDLITTPRERLLEVPGFSNKSVDLVMGGLNAWHKLLGLYMKRIDVNGKLPPVKKAMVRKGKLSGHCVSFTGYRDKAHEAAVVKAGGLIVTYGSKTTLLIYKAGGKASAKVDKAREKGIKVSYFDELGI